jgi:tRNA(fMet)-specific endonuclease VapC
MMLYMLDTDIASYLIKGKSPQVDEKLAKHHPSSICISAITKAEILYGLKSLSSENRLHLVAQEFFKLIRVLPWTEDAANWYATIRHQLKNTGQPIGEMDMMIASHALALGTQLVTNNLRHYERINAPLILVNWYKKN